MERSFRYVLKPLYLRERPELHNRQLVGGLDECEQTKKPLRAKLTAQFTFVVPFFYILDPPGFVSVPADLREAAAAILLGSSHHCPERIEDVIDGSSRRSESDK